MYMYKGINEGIHVHVIIIGPRGINKGARVHI